jgi:hypothetical protein
MFSMQSALYHPFKGGTAARPDEGLNATGMICWCHGVLFADPPAGAYIRTRTRRMDERHGCSVPISLVKIVPSAPTPSSVVSHAGLPRTSGIPGTYVLDVA